jgi:hypothetical protein
MIMYDIQKTNNARTCLVAQCRQRPAKQKLTSPRPSGAIDDWRSPIGDSRGQIKTGTMVECAKQSVRQGKLA